MISIRIDYRDIKYISYFLNNTNYTNIVYINLNKKEVILLENFKNIANFI